jgi:acyl-CoA dehydrogenase
VVSEEPVERLYREIRPLRIYEGATEVQQLIIARGIIKRFQEGELSQGQVKGAEVTHLAGERKA